MGFSSSAKAVQDIRKIDIPQVIKNAIFLIVPSMLRIIDLSVHSQYSMPWRIARQVSNSFGHS
jgi:retron-type reverse transcriptase